MKVAFNTCPEDDPFSHKYENLQESDSSLLDCWNNIASDISYNDKCQMINSQNTHIWKGPNGKWNWSWHGFKLINGKICMSYQEFNLSRQDIDKLKNYES